MVTGLSPRLAALREELDAATAMLHRIVGPLDDAMWRRRPRTGSWSAGECVEHLNATSRAMLPLLRDKLRDAHARGWTKPSARLDFFGWFLSRSLEPPVKRRFPTTQPFIPVTVGARDTVLRDWDSLQRELAGLLIDADRLSLTRIKITSPFNARIQYNAYSALRITTAHQRRHLWQAEQALSAIARQTR